MTKCKCDKCGKYTEGKLFTEDGYRLLVLCPECKKRHNEFVRDLLSGYGLGELAGFRSVEVGWSVKTDEK